MTKARITKRTVDALQCPPGKDRIFMWDAALAGFGVGAFPSGRKVYVAQYRQNGRSRRISIGEHGRLTPEEARSQAKVLLGAVETGADPIVQRCADRAIPTIRELAAEFLASHIAQKRKTRTGREYTRLLNAHILPAIGSYRISDLRRADVAKLHGALADRPYEANRVLAIISAICNWAVKAEKVLLTSNPATNIERYPEQARERFLSTDELSRLGEAIEHGETIGFSYDVDETNPRAKHASKPENRYRRLDPHAAAAIRLLILTGARVREILDAKWENVDLERGVIFLTTSKTGKKTLYLAAAAQSVIQAIPRIEGNPFIIVGSKSGRPRADLKKPWAAIQRSAKLQGLRLHDLRHSFASIGAGASLGLPIIGKLLGHSQAATTARYAHLDADPMRRAANSIGNTIAGAMSKKKTAQIIPLMPLQGGTLK